MPHDDDMLKPSRLDRQKRMYLLIGGGVLAGAVVLAVCGGGAAALLLRKGGGGGRLVETISGPAPTMDDAAYREMKAAYESNRVVAAKRYVGRRFRITGVVNEVYEPNRLLLRNKIRPDTVMTYYALRGSQIESLKAGQPCTVEGALSSFESHVADTFKIEFTDGTIVSPPGR